MRAVRNGPDAGIRDDNIKPAELSDAFIQDCLEGGKVADICAACDDATTLPVDGGRHAV